MHRAELSKSIQPAHNRIHYEDVGNVKFSIYNALGEKVAELVKHSTTSWQYQYQWKHKVATGMYIYELRTDKFVSVIKMLLFEVNRSTIAAVRFNRDGIAIKH